MKVRVTPSARRELLETIVTMRDRDRAEAVALFEAVAERLDRLADGDEDAGEVGSIRDAAVGGEGHRLYVRERGDTLWLLAVWPETAPGHGP